eukprot:3704177-Alexandrium_andersonii.AAC.1
MGIATRIQVFPGGSAFPEPPEAPAAHLPARLVGRFGMRANNGAARTPSRACRPTSRPVLGPR